MTWRSDAQVSDATAIITLCLAALTGDRPHREAIAQVQAIFRDSEDQAMLVTALGYHGATVIELLAGKLNQPAADLMSEIGTLLARLMSDPDAGAEP